MDQYQLSSQRSSLLPLPTMTSDTTWSWSSSCGLKVGGSNLVQCTMDQSSKDSQWIPGTNCQVEVQNKCSNLFDFRVGRHVTIVTMLWWSERAMAKKKFEMCDDQCWPLLWMTKLFKSWWWISWNLESQWRYVWMGPGCYAVGDMCLRWRWRTCLYLHLRLRLRLGSTPLQLRCN